LATISDPSSVDLYAIIGAPLLAIVQAEAQAAQATASFIEKVGFEPPSGNAGDLAYGRLKMLTFTYSKLTAGGDRAVFEVEIPVLSVVPIPSLEVRDATIDFSVEVTDVVRLDEPTAINARATGTASPVDDASDGTPVLGRDRSMNSELVAFKGSLGRHDSSTGLKIHLEVGQAATPTGLLSLFRLMEQGVNARSVQARPVEARRELEFGDNGVVVSYVGDPGARVPKVQILGGVGEPVTFAVSADLELTVRNVVGRTGAEVAKAWEDTGGQRRGFAIGVNGSGAGSVTPTGNEFAEL
jgi:hypothetical protein